ncbi:MAG: methylglyoxal synthase [Spirochaetes bacterium]|nr:methylglyoxal synthase [Spirochaetota bacterium]
MKNNKMKTIALVAHDECKQDLVEWANYNKKTLKEFKLVGTSGTAKMIHNITGLVIDSLGHGPDGGDVFIAHGVLTDQIHRVIFFIDVKTPQGHEHDIQTLIRNCVLKNVPLALNRETANYVITSKLMNGE